MTRSTPRGSRCSGDRPRARSEQRPRPAPAAWAPPAVASREGGRRRRERTYGLQEGQAEVAPDLLRQLATMIEAGVSVVAALVTLEEQTDDKYLREVIIDVRSDVEPGVLSKSAGTPPERLQPPLRRDGGGGRVLGNAGHGARPRRDPDREGDALKRRVKSAMVYPIVVSGSRRSCSSSCCSSSFLCFKVFDQLSGHLPTPTRIVIDASNGLRHWWFLIFPAIASRSRALRSLIRSERGRRAGPHQAPDSDEDRRRRPEDRARALLAHARHTRPPQASTSSLRSRSRAVTAGNS